MSRLLVTGASGNLGLNLALFVHEQGMEVRAWTHSRPLRGAPFASRSVDLNDFVSLEAQVLAEKPDAIVHCAAQTWLEKAQQEVEATRRLNTDLPGELAKIARRHSISLVHISTDAVFDGRKGQYREEDIPAPCNVYGQSKLAGELLVQEYCPEAAVIRLVFFGWSPAGRPNLAEFFYRSLSEGREVNGFTDAIFSPLYVRHISEALLEVLQKDLHGLYHLYSPQSLSKYQFACLLAQEFGLDSKLIKAQTALEFHPDTPRALNLSMNNQKLTLALGHALPTVTEGIRALHEDFKQGLRSRLLALTAQEEKCK